MSGRVNWPKGEGTRRPPEYWRNRAVVLKAAGYRCVIKLEGICTGKATETDHITPVKQGGSHAESNLRAACTECNAELNIRTRAKPVIKSLKRKPEAHPGRIT